MINKKRELRNIEAVIFDLDNTLYDAEPLTKKALEEAVYSMINSGLKCSFDEGLDRIKQIIKIYPSKDKFEELVKFFGPYRQQIIQAGKKSYNHINFEELESYPDLIPILEKLSKRYKLLLVTSGPASQQNKKIDALDIRRYFQHILIENQKNKKAPFKKALEVLATVPKKVLVVGDRIDSEIKIANELGMTSVLVKRGKYSDMRPKSDYEKPDFTIANLREILGLLGQESYSKIVAIGGGTGIPALATGLRKYTEDLTMIVTVTDSGRSSGMLRRELNVLPPGDIRNCLIALSNSEKLMCDLFQYRFNSGSLNGHNFGNLFIAALSKVTGSFERGIEVVSDILKLKGKVYPSTLDNVHICAEFHDGKIIEEENNIIDRNNRYVHLRSPVNKVFLKPNAQANPKAIEEILKADLIILGPGCLYTSIISNLLVDGIPEAIKESRAKKVYICNIMTQQCQTYGYKASDHLRAISKYLGFCPDYVLLNSKKPSNKLTESYKLENAEIVENDFTELKKLDTNLVIKDLLEKRTGRELLWEKKDLLRHDSDKTAKVLIDLLEK